MKKMDFILIAAVLALAAALYFSGILRPGEAGGEAVIYVDGKEYQRLPLDKDTKVQIDVNGNMNVVMIQDGYADVTDADCPDKLCVNQRKIRLEGETIVCLPHKLVVEIIGGEKQEIDSVAQ